MVLASSEAASSGQVMDTSIAWEAVKEALGFKQSRVIVEYESKIFGRNFKVGAIDDEGKIVQWMPRSALHRCSECNKMIAGTWTVISSGDAKASIGSQLIHNFHHHPDSLPELGDELLNFFMKV